MLGKTLLTCFIFLLISPLVGQITIIIKDNVDQQPIIGAVVNCTSNGESWVSDVNGQVIFNTTCDTIEVSLIGYLTQRVRIPQNGSITVLLQPQQILLDQLVITGSKYKQKLSEATVSVEVLSSQLMNAVNTTKVDQVLDKMAGVQVVGGQANIRGGSGFSYGSGSRVMILLDELPALQTDAGYANWGDIPVEIIDQIEVLKGAASSLYGSAALNGIIHFRRKTPTSTPQTSAFVTSTYFLSPKDGRTKWWDSDYIPFSVQTGFSDVRKIRKVDLSTHGMASKSNSFRQDNYENRGRIGVNMVYRPNSNLALGFNSLINYIEAQDNFLWFDDLRGAYKPFPNTLSYGKRLRMMVDPFMSFSDMSGNKHRIQTRYTWVDNRNNANRGNQSNSYFGEYQFQREWEEKGIFLTSGVAMTHVISDSELFGDTSLTYSNLGVYLQMDKKWKRWTLAVGTRYEYNLAKSPDEFDGVSIPRGELEEDALVSRVGLNYTVNKPLTIRASWGQGYRFPTISERFVSTSFGGFEVYPNPLLTSERGWTSEIGMRQALGIGNWVGYIDLSGFISRYEDMIEFVFLSEPLGFKPINVGNTQILGTEVSMTGQGQLGIFIINTLLGYTYLDPRYLDFDSNQIIRDNVSTGSNELKYRSKHSFKSDFSFGYKEWSLGFSWQYYSHVINIDRRLEEPFDGTDLLKIKSFRSRNNKGYNILDIRMSYTFGIYKASAILANSLNEVYAVRPGQLDAPRNISVRLEASF